MQKNKKPMKIITTSKTMQIIKIGVYMKINSSSLQWLQIFCNSDVSFKNISEWRRFRLGGKDSEAINGM